MFENKHTYYNRLFQSKVNKTFQLSARRTLLESIVRAARIFHFFHYLRWETSRRSKLLDIWLGFSNSLFALHRSRFRHQRFVGKCAQMQMIFQNIFFLRRKGVFYLKNILTLTCWKHISHLLSVYFLWRWYFKQIIVIIHTWISLFPKKKTCMSPHCCYISLFSSEEKWDRIGTYARTHAHANTRAHTHIHTYTQVYVQRFWTGFKYEKSAL